MSVLEQRRGLQKLRAEITSEGVTLRISAPLARRQYKVRFESILSDPVEFTESPGSLPVIEGLFIALGLIFAFIGIRETDVSARTASIVYGFGCVAMGGVMALLKRHPRRQLLQLSSGDFALVVFYEPRHRAKADKFTQELSEATDRYLRETYGAPTHHESKASQLERLESLLQRGTLSDLEFEQLKAELLPKPVEPAGHYL